MSKSESPKRPTIVDLARAAGVSASTVDRVLNGRSPVRREKAEAILATAEAIGFRATGALRKMVGPDKPARTLGFVLHRKESAFYRLLGDELIQATRDSPQMKGTARVEFLSDLTPAAVADRLWKFGRTVDAVAVVAPDHPRVTEAVDRLYAVNVPVFALVSNLTAENRAGYVGLDNGKVGRTAAWAIAHLCQMPGKIGIVVGSHRYRCQEAAEMGFRSYFREHAPDFPLLEPLVTLEDQHYAHASAAEMLNRHIDLQGLFINGGGVEGILRALREGTSGRHIVTIGYDLTPETRSGLVEGVVKMVLSHPRKIVAETLVAAMAEVLDLGTQQTPKQITVPMDVFTSENL